MELIFNELSLHHGATSRFEAQELMKNLLQTCKTVRASANKRAFNHLRVRNDFFELKLAQDYTINDWLKDNAISRTYKDLLLGLKRYPFIDQNDENIENRFIQNCYFLNEYDIEALHGKAVEGLAVAFLYNTLAISFTTHQLWDKTQLKLLEKSEKEQHVQVNHLSRPNHVEFHSEWIVNQCPLELLETDIPANQKAINLRDDHGSDVLTLFANKLVNSPYIVKIINSLPFNPKTKRFIKEVYADGKIEIVLTWTDEGFGLVVQTTGRNLQETMKIADLIEDKYRI